MPEHYKMYEIIPKCFGATSMPSNCVENRLRKWPPLRVRHTRVRRLCNTRRSKVFIRLLKRSPSISEAFCGGDGTKGLLTLRRFLVELLALSATAHAGYFSISGTPDADGGGTFTVSAVFTTVADTVARGGKTHIL